VIRRGEIEKRRRTSLPYQEVGSDCQREVALGDSVKVNYGWKKGVQTPKFAGFSCWVDGGGSE